MKEFIKRFIFIIIDLLGVNLLFKYINKTKIRILMYHGITKEQLPTFYWTQLASDKFQTQMEFLKKNYRIVTASSVNTEKRDNSVVITFDDGYQNNYSEAYPVLKSLKLPAIIFVVTGLSESGEIIWTDLLYNIFIQNRDMAIDLSKFELGEISENTYAYTRADFVASLKTDLKSFPEQKRKEVVDYLLAKYPLEKNEYFEQFKMMSKEEILKLAKTDLIQIASHSHNHPILSTLSAEEQAKEIDTSIKQLQDWSLPKGEMFAYPNGRSEDFDEATINALKNNGITMAVTTEDGLYDEGDDPYRMKRIAVGADVDLWEFKARLSGFYYFILKVRNVIFK